MPVSSGGFLPIARKVLSKRTYEKLGQGFPKFHPRAWKIIERWALHRPENLKLMDQYPHWVEDRLREQTDMEVKAFDEGSSAQLKDLGWTEQEILEAIGIDTDLVRLQTLERLEKICDCYIRPRMIVD